VDDLMMLLKSLTNAKTAMSALEITRYWQPTWTLDQVETMLASLLAGKKVCTEGHGKGHGTIRYRSASPSAGDKTGNGLGHAHGAVRGRANVAQQGGLQHGIS